MIKARALLVFCIVFIFSITSLNCKQNILEKSELPDLNELKQSKLPNDMPKDLVITYYRDSSLSAEMYKIEVSNYKIVVTDKNSKGEILENYSEKLSQKDQQNLYNVFVENKFDIIENDKRKDIVHDGEIKSEHIIISTGDLKKHITHDEANPLSREDETRYAKIKKAILELGEKL